MKITTLCYIEHNGCYLMLFRNKKEADLNEGKWIGVGGHMTEGESPDECMLREVYEETGLTLTRYDFLGVISFISDRWEDECMMLYRGTSFEGTVRTDCPEGELKWIRKEEILNLPIWEGDRLFLEEMLRGADRIRMKLMYEGDDLVGSEIYR